MEKRKQQEVGKFAKAVGWVLAFMIIGFCMLALAAGIKWAWLRLWW